VADAHRGDQVGGGDAPVQLAASVVGQLDRVHAGVHGVAATVPGIHLNFLLILVCAALICAVAGALILVLSKAGDRSIADLIWPIFGSANQLVAALALLTVAVWLKKGLKVDNRWLIYPMWFMLATTITALCFLIVQRFQQGNLLLVSIAVLLLVLAFFMVREAMIAIKDEGEKQTAAPE